MAERPSVTPDRRVRRTRRILNEALIELILEKGYERITVQDILDRADVGRSTFYAHFRDKEGLLTAEFDELRSDLHRQVEESGPDPTVQTLTQPAAALFTHAYQYRQVYRALCGRQGGMLVQRHLRGIVGAALRSRLSPADLTESGVPVEVAAEFYTSAALGLLVWWIDRDFPFSPRRLTGMYQNLICADARRPRTVPLSS